MKVLIATEKPFAKVAVDGIRKIVTEAGFELAVLERYSSEDELCQAVADAGALIVRSDKVTRKVIESAKNLKIVVRAGAGFDNLDLAACTDCSVVAMNTPGQNSNAVAELAFGLMIYMSRNGYQAGTGTELKGKTLGIQAYGNIGRLVAGIAKGFGMRVLAFDPFVQAADMEKDGVVPVSCLDDLYAQSQFVSLHIPATEQTKKSIGYNLIGKMPKGGCLINTARKEVIHEGELDRILEERPDIKYATDVAPESYSDLSSKYGTRVFATPKKIGAETSEANVNAGLAAARQIVGFIKEGNERFRLNK